MGERSPLFVLAHRGGRGPSAAGVRENSLAAFQQAMRAGADGVELDVRRTADGELVVVHDTEIPGVGPVHSARSGDLPWWVPTLAAALDACGDAIVDIEVKNAPTEPGFDPEQRVAREVVALLALRERQAVRSPSTGGPRPRQHWLVTSFWPDTLEVAAAAAREAAAAAAREAAAAAAREVAAAQAAGGPAAAAQAAGGPAGACAGGVAIALGLLVHPMFDPGGVIDRAAGLGCSVLLPHWSRTDAGLVERAAGAGLAVVAWTVDRPDEVRCAARAGVLGVVADDVAAAVAVREGV